MNIDENIRLAEQELMKAKREVLELQKKVMRLKKMNESFNNLQDSYRELECGEVPPSVNVLMYTTERRRNFLKALGMFLTYAEDDEIIFVMKRMFAGYMRQRNLEVE